MTGAHDLTGAAHKRFVIITTLLSLIDPVRGEPTVHSLDRHPHDGAGKHENHQKKFLDSFALICSTSRVGGDTASAVCLEQGHISGGNVLRLARNLGVPPELTNQLQEVLDDLAAVAAKEMTVKLGESKILFKIINVTRDKILSLLEKLCNPEIHTIVQQAISTMEADDDSLGDGEGADFRQWIANLPILVSLKLPATPTQLMPHIEWAAQARWRYAEQIEALFCSEGQELPAWIRYIYKLGRYYVATKSMLKLATKQPDLFTSIHVEAVPAPAQTRFSLGKDKMVLSTALRRLTKTDPEPLMKKLSQIWLTNDPEDRLRRACRRLMLTVHAEMQLLAFYDHHPDLTPRLLFMGTSKKACFLCHEFMSRHSLAMGVSASHQKIYPSWMAAPCSSTVRKKHKKFIWDLTQHLEQTLIRDLDTRLGVRRPKTLDSTAGPSLTTTGTVSTGWWISELPLRSLSGDEQDSSSTAAVDAGQLELS
ncbi:hypothetical protein CONLIGDRAFT_695336 [Coniochaeta ligniaria NRRL 30616]|uniref:Uncharacterized protein n=1 Tax=Coniochaeta ligniaria NRRL 30616 TaxID=1408157 RepID=A0A1J7JI48_9PEZI|nr:hypothetical protein CONLIGDRAFT_695336 [Coniochaeta ligniaria NRRL 30616]